MSSVVDSSESDAVNRNTYTPAVVNDADVDNELAFPNVVVPGPDTCDQVTVTVAGGFGSPSSEAVPTNAAVLGRVTV
jgi:hypothetical protein